MKGKVEFQLQIGDRCDLSLSKFWVQASGCYCVVKVKRFSENLGLGRGNFPKRGDKGPGAVVHSCNPSTLGG